MGIDIGKKVLEFAGQNRLFEKGETVIAGVSGGADSMCMLLLLLEMRETCGLKIVVAHVDHGIRGAEAEEDAAFVGEFCQLHDITFELAKADIPSMAKNEGKSCEEAGRDFRYVFFRDTALKYGAGKIAVAHNGGDNAETVLFNIFRGSGVGGLKGIVPKRLLSKEKPVYLVRPILCLSRLEIEEYLKVRGQEYRTDSTNSDAAYSRNRIRNDILPVVRKYINENAEGHIFALSRQAAELEEFLEIQAEQFMPLVEVTRNEGGDVDACRLDYSGISGLHPVIRFRLIRKALGLLAGRLKDIEEVHIRAVDELYGRQSGKKLMLPYDITAVKEYEHILLKRKESASLISSHCSFRDPVKSGKIAMEIRSRKDLEAVIPRNKNVKWFDFDKIGEMPVIRTMKDGDYLLIGKEQHKKALNRFMIDNKIPVSKRPEIALLAAGSHILWVVGYRQDESSLVTEETENVLVVRLQDS